jgi:hypothetical protein
LIVPAPRYIFFTLACLKFCELLKQVEKTAIGGHAPRRPGLLSETVLKPLSSNAIIRTTEQTAALIVIESEKILAFLRGADGIANLPPTGRTLPQTRLLTDRPGHPCPLA